VSKLWSLALLAFGVFFLVSNPVGAAALVSHVFGDLGSVARALSSFLSSL
jgi:hypothetical protein